MPAALFACARCRVALGSLRWTGLPDSSHVFVRGGPVSSRAGDIARSRRSVSSAADRFSPFAPPPPSSLPPPAPPKQYRRTRKWARRLLYTSALVAAVWGLDRTLYASSLSRSARTFAVGLLTAVDYKVNFREDPPLAPSIEALHARNAARLFDLLRANGGLYLKIGQAIAMQSAILPPQFQRMFARMFDDAPQNSWRDVETVVREDFGGRSVEEVFGVSFAKGGAGDQTTGVMEREARASASVAQVHWARLADGREVAIKIQKREIASQVGWDLWTFKVITWIYSKWFDIPFYSLVPYITERLMLETDFENEARNSERMAKLVEGEPRLRGRVHIPKVYKELSSKRVMTAEWIEGVRLWDKDALTARWRGGWREASPGCRGAPLDNPEEERKMQQAVERQRRGGTGGSISSSSSSSSSSRKDRIKPERDWWRGADGKGGLGLSLKEVMTTLVDLFSAQMFLWGVCHADPHPGNIFVRRLASGHAEIVLIDHGLYVDMRPAFRHQYAAFWKALLTFDNKAIGRIVREWGINDADMFASATLMRPYEGGSGSTRAEVARLSKGERSRRHYEAQQRMRQGVRDMLADESKWPRELIFIGRTLRIIQGNNQFMGSPVNRIKITGNWASRALVESRDLPLAERARNAARHLLFKFVLFSSDVVFYFSKARQMLGLGGGMEDDIEQQMKVVAKDMGVELNHDLFEG